MNDQLAIKSKIVPVSIVIPCSSNKEVIERLLLALYKGDAWAREIIIIDSAMKLKKENLNSSNNNSIWDFSYEFNSSIKVIDTPTLLFPGAARNLGCKYAKEEWIGFLDVNTIPDSNWLSSSYNFIINESQKLIIGSTRYEAKTYIQKLFITSTYGERAVKTLPGTILNRSVLEDVGLFIPCIRSAEDTDWLLRAEQFCYLKSAKTDIILKYYSIPKTINKLCKKWFRNYFSCAPVVFHLESQKSIYFLFGNIICLFIAFNWNHLIANWNESNLLYFKNITKLTLVFLISLYCFVRAIYMPLRRGTSLRLLLPFRWLGVACTCICLDFTKLFAFLASLIAKKSN